MLLFGPPNIRKLEEQRNVLGLVSALNYQKDRKIGKCAALALVDIYIEKSNPHYSNEENKRKIILDAIKRLELFQLQINILQLLENMACWKCGTKLISVGFSTVSREARFMGNVGHIIYNGYICNSCGRLVCKNCQPEYVHEYHDYQRGWTSTVMCPFCSSYHIGNYYGDNYKYIEMIKEKLALCFF